MQQRFLSFFLCLLFLGTIQPVDAFIPQKQHINAVLQIFGQIKDPENGTFTSRVSGSGFFYDVTGVIATNAHVVIRDDGKPYDRYLVCLQLESNTAPDCTYTADLQLADLDSDLALLSPGSQDIAGNPHSLPVQNLPFADLAQTRIGDEINILGYPGAGGSTITYTAGVISGFTYASSDPEFMIWIKTDAKFNPGNSGGLALDANGKVLGMPTFVVGEGQGIGYLRPVSFIREWKKEYADRLIRNATALPLIVKLVPTYVEHVTIIPGDTTASLRWPPAFSSDGIKHYEITYDTKAIDLENYNGPVQDLPNYQTTVEPELVLKHLQNDTTYHLYIRPVSQHDVVSHYWSDAVTFMPQAEVTVTPEVLYGTGLFSDVSARDVHVHALSYLKKHAIVRGYPDGSFRPETLINRAELVKLLLSGQGIDPDAVQYRDCFPDVTNQWFAPPVCYAKERGWIQGYADGLFRPESSVNHAEAVKIILNGYGLGKNLAFGVGSYTDIQASEWYYDYVLTGENAQILEEMGQFQPARSMTRAQVAENIYRLVLIRKTGSFEPSVLWKDPDNTLVDMERYFPVAADSVWEYTAKLIKSSQNGNANMLLPELTTSLTIEKSCALPEGSESCFSLTESVFQMIGAATGSTYAVERLPTRWVIRKSLDGATGKSANYDFPETLFANRNLVQYFRFQQPQNLNLSTQNMSAQLLDGAQSFRLLGFEPTTGPAGSLSSLKVQNIRTMRLQTVQSAGSLQPVIAELLLKHDTVSYYAPDAGMVKRVTTLQIQNEDQTFFELVTEEVRNGWK